MNKEVIDALHMLLHCSLKDTEYKTQKKQFRIVKSYINKLERRICNTSKRIEALIVFWKKYSPPDNTMEISQLEDLLKILEGNEF